MLEVGQVRDYVEECLRTPGDQYNRALQDLVNYTGHFLGFAVTYGRYQGVQGQIGFDGHWQSPTGFHLVVEVKTTDVYAIKTSTLVGYVDRLIDEKKISNWDVALGLYVVGRADAQIKQIEHAIIAEKRTHQLRIISVNSMLSLAEMMKQYGLGHEDMLAVLRPSDPAIDAIVGLMARLVSEPTPLMPLPIMPLPNVKVPSKPEVPIPYIRKVGRPRKSVPPTPDAKVAYWFTPVSDVKGETAEECIQNLVGDAHIYVFGDRTPGRKQLKPGDNMCFYASGRGVVAHAIVTSTPTKGSHPKIHQPEKYQWMFSVDNAKLYLDKPVIITSTLRSQLDAFKGKDPNGAWAWFVQGTHGLTRHDFEQLTGA